jgi:hypothetical protein
MHKSIPLRSPLNVERLEPRLALAGLRLPELDTAPWSTSAISIQDNVQLLTDQSIASYSLCASQSGRLSATVTATTPGADGVFSLLWLDNNTADCANDLPLAPIAHPLLGAGKLLVSNDDNSLQQALGDPQGAALDQYLPPGRYRLDISQAENAHVTNSSSDFIFKANWLGNNGSLESIQIGGEPRHVETADFNSDGIEDLAIGRTSDGVIEIRLGLGDGTFSRVQTLHTEGLPKALYTADVNNDNTMDLVVGTNTNNQLQIFLGKEGRQFATTPDAVIAFDKALSGTVAFQLNDNNPHVDMAIPMSNGGIAIIDLDDGAILGQEADCYVVTSPGEFQSNPIRIESVSFADMNRDGFRDLLGTVKREHTLASGERVLSEVLVWQWVPRGTTGDFQYVDRIAVGDGPESIIVADFDGDGHDDFATANDRSSTLSVYLSGAPGTLPARGSVSHYSVGEDSEDLLAADLNADGNLDLMILNEDSESVTVLRNDLHQSGIFVTLKEVALGVVPDDAVVGDFNRDGTADLLVSSRDGEIVTLWGVGDGTFVSGRSATGGDGPTAVAYGDFNFDGVSDIATVSSQANRVTVLLGNQQGGVDFFAEYRLELDLNADGKVQDIDDGETITEERPAPRQIVVHDVDRDGRLDLLVVNERTKNVSMLFGLGNGTFNLDQHPLRLNAESPVALQVGLLDDDEAIDIVVVDRRSDSVEILWGKNRVDPLRQLEFDSPVRYPIQINETSTAFPEALVLQDLDIDGNIDIVTINRLSGDVSILWNNGNRHLQTDGRVAVSRTSEASSYLLHARRVATGVSLNLNGQQLPGWTPAYSGTPSDPPRDDRFSPRSIVSADFNSDGIVDLATADDIHHELSILLGREGGSFQPAIVVPTVRDPEFLLAQDLNGDGHVDLVAAHDFPDKAVVLFGRGDGTFGNERRYSTRSAPESVSLADVNADGFVDILVGASRDAKISVLLNDGKGEFIAVPHSNTIDTLSLPSTLTGLEGSQALTAGELIGGDTFVATVGANTGELNIVRRGTDGVYRTEQHFLDGGKLKFVTVGDFDGDSHDDILGADTRENRVYIFWGPSHEEETFQRQILQLGSTSVSTGGDTTIRPLVLADINADGAPDIVTIEESLQQVVAILGSNSRNLSTAPATRWALGAVPVAMSAGDYNGDGITDVAVSSLVSHNVSILHGSSALSDPSIQTPLTQVSRGLPTHLRLDEISDGRKDRLEIDLNTNEISVFRRMEGGTFVASDEMMSAWRGPLVADLTGDGRLDAVTISDSRELLFWPAGDGNTDLFESSRLSELHHAEKTARSVWIIDAVIATLHDAPVVVATLERLTPSGQLERQISICQYSETTETLACDRIVSVPPEFAASRLAVADIDHDNRDDLMVYGRASSESYALIFRQQSSGFHLTSQLALPDVVSDIQLGDFDDDGTIDLALVQPHSGIIRVAYGAGDGTFTVAIPYYGAPGTYVWTDEVDTSTIRQTRQPQAHNWRVTRVLSADDFNQDGLTDLISFSANTRTVSILPAKRGRSFAGLQNFTLDGVAHTAVTGHVDQDGIADLVVLYRDSNRVAVYFGTSDHEFQPSHSLIEAGESPSSLSLQDLNKDGVTDLLISSDYGDLLTLLGNGDGSFTDYVRATDDATLWVNDLDGDGTYEYITTDRANDTLTISSSRGPHQEFATQSFDADDGIISPGNVAAGYLNDDDVLDLVVPLRGSNEVFVYLSDSTAGHSRHLFPVGTQPIHVTVGDFTGDGRDDIVVANRGSNDITTLISTLDGKGAWTLKTGPRLAVGRAPVHTLLVDGVADRADGILDILVTNHYSNELQLLRGRGNGFFDDVNVTRYATAHFPVQSFILDGSIFVIEEGSRSVTQFVDGSTSDSRTSIIPHSFHSALWSNTLQRLFFLDPFGREVSQYFVNSDSLHPVQFVATFAVSSVLSLAIDASAQRIRLIGYGTDQQPITIVDDLIPYRPPISFVVPDSFRMGYHPPHRLQLLQQLELSWDISLVAPQYRVALFFGFTITRAFSAPFPSSPPLNVELDLGLNLASQPQSTFLSLRVDTIVIDMFAAQLDDSTRYGRHNVSRATPYQQTARKRHALSLEDDDPTRICHEQLWTLTDDIFSNPNVELFAWPMHDPAMTRQLEHKQEATIMAESELRKNDAGQKQRTTTYEYENESQVQSTETPELRYTTPNEKQVNVAPNEGRSIRSGRRGSTPRNPLAFEYKAQIPLEPISHPTGSHHTR